MQGPYVWIPGHVWIPGQGVEPDPIDVAEAIEPGLAGEGQIERFSGAWPGACEWELRAESTEARIAHTPRQPINEPVFLV